MSSQSITFDQKRSTSLALATGLGALCVFALILWLDRPRLLNYVYPVSMAGIAAWLYASRPPLYYGFVWLVWFFTPFVRRYVDHQIGGYSEISFVMLAPVLATGVSILTVLRYGGRLREPPYMPIGLAMLGVIYGYLVGIARVGPLSATFAFLEWFMPLLMAFHLLLLWGEYPGHRRVMRQVFVWGVLIMGAYGVYQYFYIPQWDVRWLVESGMMSSMGKPVPQGFRVFSTLNATGPFAMIMMVGLVLLFDARGPVSRLAAVPGYVSFMLSLVRSAWGGWVVTMGLLVLRLRGAVRKRFIVLLAVSAVVCVPLFAYESLGGRVGARMETFSSMEDDGSLNARLGLYRSQTANALLSPIGEGLGSTGKAAKLSKGEAVNFDSGLLKLPLTLGWIGCTLYLAGLVWMFRRAFRVEAAKTDLFVSIASAMAATYLILLLFSDHLSGATGLLLWSFMALSLAADRYYAQQAQEHPVAPSSSEATMPPVQVV